MTVPSWALDLLRCPLTQSPLEPVSRVDLEQAWRAPALPVSQSPLAINAPDLLAAESRSYAYPLLEGLPVLLGPERLFPGGHGDHLDVTSPPYDEAYQEMGPYNERNDDLARQARATPFAESLTQKLQLSTEERQRFPDPWWRWVENDTELTAAEDALRHLRPLDGATVLQLGGDGLGGLNLLAAGAERLVLVSPIINELRIFAMIAATVGFADRVLPVVAIGEELPIRAKSVDVVHSPACIHHMHTDLAFPEINRVLAPGGRFSSYDIYEVPFYRLAIKLFGKREPGVNCKPLNKERLKPVAVFDDATYRWHGTSVRYLTTLLARFRDLPDRHRLYRLAQFEDRLAGRFPSLKRFASEVCVLARTFDDTELATPSREAEPRIS